MFALTIFLNDGTRLGSGVEFPELFDSADAAKWFVWGLMEEPGHGVLDWMIVVQ